MAKEHMPMDEAPTGELLRAAIEDARELVQLEVNRGSRNPVTD